MEKAKVLDSTGVQTRSLTKEEKRRLDQYQFDYEVKAFISKIWSSKPEPVVKKISLKTNIIGIVMTTINVLLPVVLWLQFLDPEGLSIQPYVGEKAVIYMEGIHRLGIFLLWAIVVFLFIFGLFYFPLMEKIKEDEKEVWQTTLLDEFRKKNVIRKTFFSVVSLAIVLGLILNSYYVTAVFYLIAIAINYGIRNGYKNKVKEQIKKQIGIEI